MICKKVLIYPPYTKWKIGTKNAGRQAKNAVPHDTKRHK